MTDEEILASLRKMYDDMHVLITTKDFSKIAEWMDQLNDEPNHMKTMLVITKGLKDRPEFKSNRDALEKRLEELIGEELF